jgi:cell division protein FtsB
MRLASRLIFQILLILSTFTITLAQNSSVENLRSQLSDIQTKETELQNQMKQLDEDLKPENIERFFALNGSTHPEELREQRRKQLEAQKASVQAQLDQLATRRTRLEAAISSAESAAARAGVTTSTFNQPSITSDAGSNPTTQPKSQRRIRRKRSRHVKKHE